MKQYVKDSNGKYKFVDRDQKENLEGQKWVQSVMMEGQKLKELEDYVKILEAMFASKKK